MARAASPTPPSQSFGGIDILINNAADFTQKSVEQAEVADWQKVLGVNVIGTALVSKYAIPHMKAKGGGSIVNMASMSGIIAQPDFATYNASKGAVLTMTKCMALDLAPYKIRVNSICPGCILTSASYREIERLGLTFEQWRDRVAPLHMLNRLGEPREVANAALFLASDEASFITGTHLMVDGGYTGGKIAKYSCWRECMPLNAALFHGIFRRRGPTPASHGHKGFESQRSCRTISRASANPETSPAPIA